MKTYATDETPLLSRGLDPRERRPTRVRFWTAAAATFLILAALNSQFRTVCQKPWSSEGEIRAKPFDWDDISATESLEFHHCFSDFECAKLKVPLDYFNGTYPNSSVSIAIAKLPAKVPVDHPRYGGPILINPGGPGGSGSAFALMVASQLQVVVDPTDLPGDFVESQGRYYDILGFDPRGIGLTEPRASCLRNEASAWSWKLRESTEGGLDSSDAALGRLWSMTHAYGMYCGQGDDAEEGPDIKQYMSTASVARDMLEIAEKHAGWVAEKTTGISMRKGVENSSHYERGSVKLQYWGFSYGTFLGSTFASMFPDRVGRVILDGVVNARDYNNALGQGSLLDTEKNLKSFYTSCLLSGPGNCPLATSTSSARDIEQRVQNILDSLYHSPIAINTANGPEILTYTDVKRLMFSALYQPSVGFSVIASILAEVENGGGDILDIIAGGFRPTHIYSCPVNGSIYRPDHDYEVAQDAILCGDGIDQTSLSINAFEDYWHLLESLSPAGGSLWAMLKMKCAAWNVKAVYKLSSDDDFGGNTSHPILWLSNTADPVTPLNSARIMARRFPGSVVLVQDSAGHCSISTPVPCTMKAVKEYFQTGSLPDPETVCIPPTSPLSLNSTDPNSPFYDPSLGQPVFLAADDMKNDMDAAKSLQSWAAGASFFGNGQHLGDMLHSAALLRMKVASVDEM